MLVLYHEYLLIDVTTVAGRNALALFLLSNTNSAIATQSICKEKQENPLEHYLRVQNNCICCHVMSIPLVQSKNDQSNTILAGCVGQAPFSLASSTVFLAKPKAFPDRLENVISLACFQSATDLFPVGHT